MLTGLRQELAVYYWYSGSARFDGEHSLAAHRERPDAPPSPYYLHYPGGMSNNLAGLFDTAGGLLAELTRERQLVFDRIAPVPFGADPVGTSLLEHLGNRYRLLRFKKEETPDGQTRFSGPLHGFFRPGVTKVVGVDDHISGGYTKLKFLEALDRAGLRITDFLAVVDREQGGREFLASLGITLHSLLTISELVEYYAYRGWISAEKAAEVQAYTAANQLWPVN
jgi:orotate phosphoribosyltransferase